MGSTNAIYFSLPLVKCKRMAKEIIMMMEKMKKNANFRPVASPPVKIYVIKMCNQYVICYRPGLWAAKYTASATPASSSPRSHTSAT